MEQENEDNMFLEAKPTFLDFRVSNVRHKGRKKDIEVSDLVIDKHGIIGIVRFTTEDKGNYIEFIDGFETYDKKLNLKKLSSSNEQLFLYHQRYFGFITRIARVLQESFEEDFPHVNIINNGKELFVRASTSRNIVRKYVAAKLTANQSLISVKLTPFYNLTVEQFDVERSKRQSRFVFNVLKNMFIDIDLKTEQANRIKFIINDDNTYNTEHWLRMKRMFSKFRLKYVTI